MSQQDYRHYINKINSMTENEKQQLIGGFLQFVKSIGSQAKNLQILKQTLAYSLKTTPLYILAFQEIDLQKRGIITEESMRNYCMRNRIKRNAKSIVGYIGRYGYRQHLDFDEFVLALQPFQPIQPIQLIQSIQAEDGRGERSQNGERANVSRQVSKASVLAILREIINAEMTLITAEYQELNSLLKCNYKQGCLLWRMLDREHTNSVSSSQFQQDPSIKEDWKHFVQRTWGTANTLLNRSMFMQLVAKCIRTCKFIKKVNQSVEKQAKVKQKQQQKVAQQDQDILKYAANRVSIVTQTFSSFIQKTQPKDIKVRNSKTVLKGKAGYCTVSNPIKSVMII